MTSPAKIEKMYTGVELDSKRMRIEAPQHMALTLLGDGQVLLGPHVVSRGGAEDYQKIKDAINTGRYTLTIVLKDGARQGSSDSEVRLEITK